MVLKKVNINDMLQARRPYKSLTPHRCSLCKGSGELVDHLFLHCPITLGLWHKLFRATNLEWVPLRNIGDIFIISFKGLGKSIKGKTLWHIACLIVLWIVELAIRVGLLGWAESTPGQEQNRVGPYLFRAAILMA